LRDIVPDDVVTVPIIEDVSEHRSIEISGVGRKLFQLKHKHQLWTKHQHSLDKELFEVRLEYFLAELAEVQISISYRVQFQTKSRHADDIRREVSNHLSYIEVIANFKIVVEDVN